MMLISLTALRNKTVQKSIAILHCHRQRGGYTRPMEGYYATTNAYYAGSGDYLHDV